MTEQGLLLTGAFGVGKSSVAIEIAETLESRGVRYALLDLDFLRWGYSGEGDRANESMCHRNVAAVVDNYRAVGVTHFVLAGFVRDEEGLRGLEEAVGISLRVVRIEAPMETIRARLAEDPSTARAEDLRQSEEQVSSREGAVIAKFAVLNDGLLSDAADRVLTLIGWTSR